MRQIDILKEINKWPVFDVSKAAQLFEKDHAYTRLYLHRLKKRGLIRLIEKNKYTLQNDAFLIASHIVWPSYLSLWTALSYHHLTEQISHDIWIITTRKRNKRILTFGNITLRFIHVQPKYLFGYKKIIYGGREIFMAAKEKAILDAVLTRRISRITLMEIVSKQKINKRRLYGYARRTKNKRLMHQIRTLIGGTI